MPYYVKCNSVGSRPHCHGCGAAVPHRPDSCEPCPVNAEAHCLPILIGVGSKVKFWHYHGMPKVEGEVVSITQHGLMRVKALNGFAEVHEASLEPVIDQNQS